MGYSNNIIGDPLNKTAIDQLNARSLALSQPGSRILNDDNALDYTNIVAYGNSNCWIKMTSLIDIVDPEGKNGFLRKIGSGADPAKEWALFSGLTPEGKPLRYGIDAYEVGYEAPLAELGYRPMPGIVSATIQTAGRNGSLKMADIKIRANTLEQLEVLDILFFRLGYSCLLEWGHVMYLDSTGGPEVAKLTTFDSSRLINAFKPGLTKEDILKQIYTNKKETCGNYEGMLGLITNYNWVSTDDGGYECTVKLTGLGSVLDSLKVNNLSGLESIPTIGVALQKEFNTATAKQTDAANRITILTNEKNALNAEYEKEKQVLVTKYNQALELRKNKTAVDNATLSALTPLSSGQANLTIDQVVSDLEIVLQVRNGQIYNGPSYANTGYTDTEIEDFIKTQTVSGTSVTLTPSSAGVVTPGSGAASGVKTTILLDSRSLPYSYLRKRYATIQAIRIAQKDLAAANAAVEKVTPKLQNYLQVQGRGTTVQPSSAIEAILTDINYRLLVPDTDTKAIVDLTTGPPLQYVGYNTLCSVLGGPDYFKNLGLGLIPSSTATAGYGDSFATGSLEFNFAKGFNPEVLLGQPNTVPTVAFDNLFTILSVRTTVYSPPQGSEASYVKASDAQPKLYIKFGALLALLNSIGTLYEYQGVADKKPLTYINFNPDTNLCYTNFAQVSIRPDVCLIPWQFKWNPTITNDNKGAVAHLDKGTTTVWQLLEAHKIPVDIANKILTQVHSEAFTNYGEVGIEPDSIGAPFYFSDYTSPVTSAVAGKLMNVYLSIDYLKSLYLQIPNTNTASNVVLTSFLEQILSDIQKSLGNVNSFRIGYDDEANCLTIYDDQIVDYTETQKDKGYQPIPVFGTTSVAKAFSINTETSTRLGSMLAITAMDPRNARDAGGNLNTDGSSFTVLNEYLSDRIMPKRTTDPLKKEGEVIPEINELSPISQLATIFLTYLYRYYAGQFRLNTVAKLSNGAQDDINNYPPVIIQQYQQSAINFYIAAMNILKGRKQLAGVDDNGDTVTANAIMPISCNITTAGISNMTVYEGFIVPANRLPKQYLDETGKQKVGFVVAGQTHTIAGNTWTTATRGLMINLPTKAVVRSNNPTVAVQRTASSPKKTNKVEKRDVVVGPCTCKTAYNSELKVQNVTHLDLVPIDTVINFIKQNVKSTFGDSVARSTLAVMLAEARQVGTNFRSAGGFNFGGIQTDNRVWKATTASGAAASGIKGFTGFSGQFCRRDNGNDCRMFAMFKSWQEFIWFLANRLKAKGFSSAKDSTDWAKLYINEWWSPGAKASYTPDTTIFKSKASIFTKAQKLIG